MNAEFWAVADKLIETSDLVIDRASGSAHPRYPDFIYPLDYGYLGGTKAMDGGGIDVWKGNAAGRGLVAVMCTIDVIKRDSEIKLLIDCTDEEITIVNAFHNESEFMRGLLIWR